MQPETKELTDIHRREAAFFDDMASDILNQNRPDQECLLKVDIESALRNYPEYYQFAYQVLGDLRGRTVLDMGCGNGKSSVILAGKGAIVEAFDISPKSIEVARRRAEINGVENRIRFGCMTAEKMEYATASFDIVFGVGILHHIRVETAASEIARVLKEDGRAVFIEPIAFSPFLKRLRNAAVIKKLVPNKGKEFVITEDERQLYREDLEAFRPFFARVGYRPFQLLSRLDRIIGGYPVRRNFKLVAMLNRFDRMVLSEIPALSSLGRWAVILLGKEKAF